MCVYNYVLKVQLIFIIFFTVLNIVKDILTYTWISFVAVWLSTTVDCHVSTKEDCLHFNLRVLVVELDSNFFLYQTHLALYSSLIEFDEVLRSLFYALQRKTN